MPKNHLRILTDRDPIALAEEHISGEGYLNISARIARIGIQTYQGYELAGLGGEIDPDKTYRVYRPEEEVFAVDALESFHDLPITLGHPSQEVTADNYKSHAVGHVIGQPKRDKEFIRAELTIRDAEAIDKIKCGAARELSVGYHADVFLETGLSASGQPYDAIQKNIRGNHIALVDAARCGPLCSIVGDQLTTDCNCANCTSQKRKNMSEYVTLDGERLPVAEAVEILKEANARMAEALKDAQATIESLSADLESKSGEVEAMKAKPTEDGFTTKVQARAQMLSEARQILGDAASLASLSDNDIRRRVIDQIYGDGFASGASDNALVGMYRVAVRDALKSTDSINGQIAPTSIHTEFKQAEARRKQRLASAWQKGA